MQSVTSNATYNAIQSAIATASANKAVIYRGTIPNSYFNYREIPSFAANLDFFSTGVIGLLIIRQSTITNPTLLGIWMFSYKNDLYNGAWKLGGNLAITAANEVGTLVLNVNVQGYIAEIIVL